MRNAPELRFDVGRNGPRCTGRDDLSRAVVRDLDDALGEREAVPAGFCDVGRPRQERRNREAFGCHGFEIKDALGDGGEPVGELRHEDGREGARRDDDLVGVETPPVERLEVRLAAISWNRRDACRLRDEHTGFARLVEVGPDDVAALRPTALEADVAVWVSAIGPSGIGLPRLFASSRSTARPRREEIEALFLERAFGHRFARKKEDAGFVEKVATDARIQLTPAAERLEHEGGVKLVAPVVGANELREIGRRSKGMRHGPAIEDDDRSATLAELDRRRRTEDAAPDDDDVRARRSAHGARVHEIPIFSKRIGGGTERAWRMARTIIIGDVHGCRDELEDLLAYLGYTRSDEVFFVGDLVVRGPDPRGTLALVRALHGRAVRGNHEDRLLRWHFGMRGRGNHDADKPKKHRRNGDKSKGVVPKLGPTTRATADKLRDEDWSLLASLPLWIDIPEPGIRIVHAGVLPDVPIDEQEPRTLLHLRTLARVAPGWPLEASEERGRRSWAHFYTGPEHVVFGHNAQPEPEIASYATGIDTGAVYGGRLSALVLRDGEEVPPPAERNSVIVSVPARRAYFTR